MSSTAEQPRPTVSARVARAALSLAVLAGLLYWALWFTILFVLRCDENCSGDAYDSWRYPAQFGIGVVGFGLGVLALALGFTKWRTTYRVCLFVAAGCLAFWVAWVLVFGTF